MTCIIGLVDNGKVYMGADSAGSDGHRINTYKAPKVWAKKCKAGEFIFGVCGSYLLMQVLRHDFDPPRLKEGQDADEYMVSEFVPALREALHKAGCKDGIGIEPSMGDADFLVGFRGRLFSVMSNFSVLEDANGYDATGSGIDYAKGCLYGTKGMAKERILKALECAESFVTTVRGPFTVVAEGEASV